MYVEIKENNNYQLFFWAIRTRNEKRCKKSKMKYIKKYRDIKSSDDIFVDGD